MEYRKEIIRQIIAYLEEANERELRIALEFIRSLTQKEYSPDED